MLILCLTRGLSWIHLDNSSSPFGGGASCLFHFFGRGLQFVFGHGKGVGKSEKGKGKTWTGQIARRMGGQMQNQCI